MQSPCNKCISKVVKLLKIEADKETSINHRFKTLGNRSIWFQTKNSMHAMHWTFALRSILNKLELQHIEDKLDPTNYKLLPLSKAYAIEEFMRMKYISSQVESNIEIEQKYIECSRVG